MSTSLAMQTARDLIETLLSRGVREAVLSPGSRSGPIALALAAADSQGLLRLHVRIDEREAAFLALGIAKRSGQPVAVLTTSGTAVANLHPAMLEAWHARVPIIAVTADRPARLWGTGANQTTHQIGLLAPVETLSSVRELDESMAGSSGPTHLNLELDQPLITSDEWVFRPPASTMREAGTSSKARTLGCAPATVVVAGDGAPAAIAQIAHEAGWPIVAEPSSNVRSAPTALALGRLLLTADPLSSRIERVVSVGHSTISRPVTALLSRRDIEIIHWGEQSTFPVPAGDNVSFVQAINLADRPKNASWATEWVDADQRLAERLERDDTLAISTAVCQAVGADWLLALGPSQVLRDVDLMMPARIPGPFVISNRGLAGIDGVLSTAVGAAIAHPGPSIAFVGDVTFLHGSNGLLSGPLEPQPDLTIVVLNDDGGSIFASLEQGDPEFSEHFERVYATGQNASIGALCRGMNVAHELVTVAGLAAALATRPTGVSVVEVRVSRAHRRALSQSIAQAVQGLF
ncbi:MAG: 2-succinyl-5-enolpyruvyl-6-hydroxy-3-cyclohexene-1-carboxylic-acid synthase [Aeromicrobium sp.]|nr:MAG: 2-succinyl-5-enolpyruvyl-6-hydroxy-3-cyclohexene-1-carboxylic-acid synthase [Aeromicrobium sp.]